MSSYKRFTFGPGSLETITLYRRDMRGTDGDSYRWEYRIDGSFTVYCGNGWDHTADVTLPDWYSVTCDPFDRYQVAHELVNLALEDWSDPCEDATDEDAPAIAAMRAEDGTLPAFAWPGGYQMIYYTEGGDNICPKCANEDASDLVAGEVYWEGPDQACAECGEPIPSAYGDPDA